MANRYKWSRPAEWLLDKLQGFGPDEIHQLYQFAESMAGRLDSDSIQDLFESDMDADGYFEPTDCTGPDGGNQLCEHGFWQAHTISDEDQEEADNADSNR